MFIPKPGFEGNDFNKFGAVLESHGLVRVGPLGNAVGRVWKVRDTVELGVTEYRKDPHLFVMNGVDYTPLTYGVMTDELHNEKVVVDPSLREM